MPHTIIEIAPIFAFLDRKRVLVAELREPDFNVIRLNGRKRRVSFLCKNMINSDWRWPGPIYNPFIMKIK